MQIWQNFKKNQLAKSLNKGLILRSKRIMLILYPLYQPNQLLLYLMRKTPILLWALKSMPNNAKRKEKRPFF